MLRTNGAHNSRSLYTGPVAIAHWCQNPAFTTEPIGMAIFTFHFTFSGQVGPGLSATRLPSTVKSVDGEEEKVPDRI